MPKKINKYLSGALNILYEVIAPIPPAIKSKRAKIPCHGAMFPGKMPTPSIPIPNSPRGTDVISFLKTLYIKKVAVIIIKPLIIIV